MLFSVRLGCIPCAASPVPQSGLVLQARPGAAELPSHPSHAMMQPEDTPRYLVIGYCAGSPPCCFHDDVSKREYKMGHLGYINKCRNGCFEWYRINGKQLKLAVADYVTTVGELPLPAKALFSPLCS